MKLTTKKVKNDFALVISKKIVSLIKNYAVDCTSKAKNGVWLYADSNKHKDIFIKAEGVKSYNQVLDYVNYFVHPSLESPLIDVWGKTELKLRIDELIRRKRPNAKKVVSELLNSRLPKWRVFFPVHYLSLNFEIDLGIAKLFPPGANFLSPKNNLRTHYPEIEQFPYLEIKECRGASSDMVPIMAMEYAKFALSLIPSGSEGLMLKTAPFASETMILVQNIVTKSWHYAWNIEHRGVTYNSKASHEVNRAKILTVQANKMVHRVSEKSQVSKRIKNASIMFQTAKTTTDGPSKLLLLSSCLDTLLMEKYYPNIHTKEFKKRLNEYLKVYPYQLSNRDITFFGKLYNVRSDVVHSSRRFLAENRDYLNTENVVYSLLIEFNQHKGKTQRKILKEIGVIK